MTRQEADEILTYVAQNIISPLAFDNTPAKEVWLRLSGEEFNKLCAFVRGKITRHQEHPSCFGKPMLYHHRAENGCEGCKFEAQCDDARKEKK